MGEIGVAVLVPSDPLNPPTLEELRGFAAEQIAPFKLPSELVLRDSLPLTPMEKIDRNAIREEL
jgi:fatty-acyl-CoA synthase